jgi:hypothetical protein
MTTAVYQSGEVAMEGDRVLCTDPSDMEEWDVKRVENGKVVVMDYRYDAAMFKLIRRKQEPAMSATNGWIEGAPTEPGTYWLQHKASGEFAFTVCKAEDRIVHGKNGMSLFADFIERHIAFTPPELPPAPIAFPEWRRGTYYGKPCIAHRCDNRARHQWFVQADCGESYIIHQDSMSHCRHWEELKLDPA